MGYSGPVRIILGSGRTRPQRKPRPRPLVNSGGCQEGKGICTYLYLSMTPESLVASMLPPEQFGNYLAVGTRKSAGRRCISI